MRNWIKLFERFNQPVGYKWMNDQPPAASAKFEIDGRLYTVSITGSNIYSIHFDLMKPYYGGVVSGTGDAGKVFSTVMAIVKEYLDENPPTVGFSFSAHRSQPSRVKLYNALSRLIAKQMPEYDLEIIEGDREVIYHFETNNW